MPSILEPVSIPAVASMSSLALSTSAAAAVAAKASEPVVVAEAASDPAAAVVLKLPESASAVEERASGRLLLLFLESRGASPASTAASAWLSSAELRHEPQTDSIKVPNSVLSCRSAAEQEVEFDESDEEERSISLGAKSAPLSEGGCEGSTGEGYSHRPAI